MLLNFQRHGRRLERGTSMIEAVIAIAVTAIFLAGAFALNSRALMLVRSADNTSEVDGCLRDRLEKMRNAPWDRMVDPTYIRDTVMSSTGNTFSNLPMTVTVTVSAYRPSVANASPTPASIVVTRDTSGTASITANGGDQMVNEDTVKVNIAGNWTAFKTNRTHEAYTIVASNGISGRNK